MDKTFHIYNFGCKVNQEEGGAMAALFSASGWQAAEPPAAALYVINTCTVTAVADKKCRALMRRVRREQPDAVIAVTGCYAQRAAAEISELGGMDIIAGVDQRDQLPALVERFLAERQPVREVGDISAQHAFRSIAPVSDQGRVRAYLKIEDGCDQFCHYCVIPYVRGPIRSLPREQAVAQARRLAEAGHKEIVLSGIHIGAYGSDLDEPEALPRLLDQLCAIPGLYRVHLGSVEPQQISDGLTDALQRQDKLCRHLHIPLQAGCDKTLSAMGRHYTTAQYAAIIDRLRRLFPDMAFTSDVIVGYPGETEQDFQDSLDFCRACGFADLHVFPYSRRSGTVAASLPGQLTQAVKAERAGRLIDQAAAEAERYAASWQGRALRLLAEERVEAEGAAYTRGHSDGYLALYLPGADIAPGTLLQVRGERPFRDGLLVSID